MTNAPAYKIRIGRLQATIWHNLDEKGNWYSVWLTGGYKAAGGGQGQHEGRSVTSIPGRRVSPSPWRPHASRRQSTASARR